MKNYFPLILMILFACNEIEPENLLSPCISIKPEDVIHVNDTVWFSNCTENVILYNWNFGDSTNSAEASPYHIYTEKGDYLVKLTISDGTRLDSVEQWINILEERVIACFDHDKEGDILIGEDVSFTSCSGNITDFLWDFGDGSTSEEVSPVHQYSESGLYQVKLIVSNESSIDSILKEINITNNKYTSLNDTSIGISTVSERYYYIDFDNDSVMDLSVKLNYNFGTMSGITSYIEFTPMNQYEYNLASSKEYTYTYEDSAPKEKDTISENSILSPKILNVSDIISISDNYSSEPVHVVYYFRKPDFGSQEHTVTERSSWISDDYRYMAFRKKNENTLVWLKLKVTSHSSIVFSSMHIFMNSEEVTISNPEL